MRGGLDSIDGVWDVLCTRERWPAGGRATRQAGEKDSDRLNRLVCPYGHLVDRSLAPSRRLPHVPRPRMSICILADAADIDRAKLIELEYMSVDDLKKLNKNKKLVKKVR